MFHLAIFQVANSFVTFNYKENTDKPEHNQSIKIDQG